MADSAPKPRVAAGGRSPRQALTQRSRIGFALADVARLMRTMFDARMRELGLNGSTWRLLAYLYREDGQTQAQLARLLEVSRASVGQMIDRLEESGHLERRDDPGDRRFWRVHLSARMQADIPVLIEKVREIELECFAGLTEAEIGQLNELVSRQRDHLIALQPAEQTEGK
jgi:MarR family transcriptional regulator for hemolysin